MAIRKTTKTKAGKTAGNKTAARKTKTAKAPTRKSAGRKAATKKSAAKKPAAKKSMAKTSAARKAAGKTSAARKSAITKARTKTRATRPASRSKTVGRSKAAMPPKAAPKSRPAAGVAGRAPATRRAQPRRSGRRGAIGGALDAVTRTVKRATRRLLDAATPASNARRARTGVASQRKAGAGIAIKGKMAPRYDEVLTADALAFIADLHRNFDRRRKELLRERAEKQKRFDAGALPDFLPATKHIREDDSWRVAPIPADLLDRRVEITGPVDRKMIVNALNSGASVFMADFEDANSPTWDNNVEGQLNLKDRWAKTIDFTDDTSGKHYALGDKLAVLIVRPRGWHLVEQHVTVDGQPISGSLFDFGLYLFHNAKASLAQGSGPYFYLPKLESHLEARLWNDVFVHAQRKLGLDNGTIKATVLVETLPAAFEMEEILYELRDHIVGMNAGRWDYIFSFIKTFAKNKSPNYVLPDRSQVVMGDAFLGSYASLLVKSCHQRKAFAMGGMAAQIPIKNDPAANDAAFAKVKADKEREVREGYDGTWVAHPDLVPVAREVFDRLMPQPNQLERLRPHVRVLRDDLLKIHQGSKTEDGFRLNIRVGVQYIAAWLGGRGAVPIYNLMEDAATAEISRAQIWQWMKNGAVLDDGVSVTPELFKRALTEEMARVRDELGAEVYDGARFPEAIDLFSELSLADEFLPFLTTPAYKLIA